MRHASTSTARLDGGVARRLLKGGTRIAALLGDSRRDYRAHLCRWEDDLFRHYPQGHRLIDEAEARAIIGAVFDGLDRPVPELDLVDHFADPSIGGYADIASNRIVIERGSLYRFLVLHECAHLLVPGDRRHGPAFTYVVQGLYRDFLGISEATMARFLRRHDLPSFTAIPA
ncbi:MAG TPA: hypothetical protein VNT30_06690 [Stellaceae bacterium]|nr:hypothetical protein [Stellaceae bacterium]